MPGESGASSTLRPIGSNADFSGILDHPPARVMTAEYDFAISRHVLPEVCTFVCSLRNPRAQGRPGARCTRGLVCSCAHEDAHTSIQVQRRHPAFPAQWFTAYFVLFPVNGFLATVAPEKLASQELDASTAASGPHDFAVRITRIRLLRNPRPPHPTARS